MCEYCENGKGLGDSIKGDGVFIEGSILYGIYDGGYCNCEAEINYCPMCGRKLKSNALNKKKENYMKATKKPVTIECFKYDGDLINSDGKYYVPEWAKKAYEDATIFFKDQGEMYIKTLEGDHHASVGDYVIKGVNGELYPCKPDIFEKTYDIVSD